MLNISNPRKTTNIHNENIFFHMDTHCTLLDQKHDSFQVLNVTQKVSILCCRWMSQYKKNFSQGGSLLFNSIAVKHNSMSKAAGNTHV